MKSKITNLAAKLKHQIIILENIAISEVMNEKWEKKFITFAEILPVSDNKFQSLEGLSFGHIITEGYFIFKIRFLKGLTTKMRIEFKYRNFEIKRIIDISEQNRLLQLICLEL